MSGAGAEAAGVAGEPVQGEPGGEQGGHHHPARLEGIQPEVPVLEDGHPCQECGECVKGGQKAEHAGADGSWQQPGGGGECRLGGCDTHHGTGGASDESCFETDQQQEGKEADEEINFSQRAPSFWLLEWL